MKGANPGSQRVVFFAAGSAWAVDKFRSFVVRSEHK
jgi:hypothetical protein